MRIHRIALAALLTIASGCSIEPTPREYIDRPRTEEPQAAVRDAIDERVRLVVQHLAAGDPAGARAALSPAPDVRVYGPHPNDRFESAAQVDSLLELIAGAARDALRLRRLEVEADPRGTVAWFGATLEYGDAERPVTPLQVTGVFRLREGEWELAQAHVASAANGAATEPYPAGQRARAGVE